MTETDLSIVPAASSAELAEMQHLVSRAREWASHSQARNTQRAYHAAWTTFQAWCDQRSLPSLPASSGLCAAYLASLADAGCSISSIRQAHAAIARRHLETNAPWPAGGGEAVRQVLRGIANVQAGRPPEQKAPVLARDLRAILDGVDDGTVWGLRNRSLLLVGWNGAFRRSELVALEVRDLLFGDRGVTIRVRKSKTDQEGKGFEKAIPFGMSEPLCAVRQTKKWLQTAGITDGHVYRRIRRTRSWGKCTICPTGIGDEAVVAIVKIGVEAAGLDPALYAGHSLRAGFVTTAAQAGRQLDQIMRQTGHRTTAILMKYIRRESLFEDNAAEGLL